MTLTWWEKGLWQICMHHWTKHEKVDFPKILSGTGGVYSTTFDTKLRNEAKKFSNPGGVHSLATRNGPIHKI